MGFAKFLIAFGFAMVLLGIAVLREQSAENWRRGAVGLFFGLLGASLIWAGRVQSRKQEGRLQVRKDLLASAIAGDQEAFPDSPVVYLRPFVSTNQYRVKDGARSFYGVLSDGDAHDDIERIVSRALNKHRAFIGLGQPGEHHGAGRLLVGESSWKEHVLSLCDRAFALIVLPSFREGTLWEVAQIVQRGWLKKAIFLMPPSDGRMYESSFDVAHEWAATRVACASLGLNLPPHQPRGAIFRYVDGSKVPTIEDMPAPEISDWEECIGWLLQLGDEDSRRETTDENLSVDGCIEGLRRLGYYVSTVSSGVWDIEARRGGHEVAYGSEQLRETYRRLRSQRFGRSAMQAGERAAHDVN